MTPAKAIRYLLALICLAIVGWSFFDVLYRFKVRHDSLANRPIELTVLHWGDPREDSIVRTLVDEFQKLHPNVQINKINAPSNDYSNKLKTMMAGEMPPDVFYLRPAEMPEYAKAGQLATIDEQFNSDPQDWDTTFYPTPKAWRDDFFPFLVNAFKYDKVNNVVGTGPLYALPKDFTPTVFFANTNLLDRAGVDWKSIQKTGWDWARFEQEATKVRALATAPEFAGREIYGTVFNSWGDVIRAILWSYGGDFLSRRSTARPISAK